MDKGDPLPSELTGRQYLDSLTTERRRANGRVYTPREIVRFVLDQAGYTPDSPIEHCQLLDPACGAGAFLEEATFRLHKRLKSLGRGAHNFLSSAVARNLWGIDVDERACAIARRSVERAVETLSGIAPPGGFFDENVLQADFLLSNGSEASVRSLAARATIIAGNPPYVSTEWIAERYKTQLRSRFEGASGRFDLYTLFIERALSLMAPGSRLALITPDKFLKSYSASALRSNIVASSSVRSIALFSSHSIFEEAAIVPCVTVLERAGKSVQIQVKACGYRPDLDAVQTLEERTINQETLGASAWHLLSPDTAGLVTRIRASHPLLKNITVRISAGPATGRDNLYLPSERDAEDIEPELLRSAIRGRDISAYRIENPGLRILVPYIFGKGSTKLVRLTDYPGAARYLKKHRDELSSRHCVQNWGKAWYDFHDQPPLDVAKEKKIVVPDVANSNRFAVDAGDYFPLHSVYYILPKDELNLDYVVAMLNCSVSVFLIRTEAPVVKDGFNRYRRQFLMELPVPHVPARQAAEIVRAASRMDLRKVDDLAARAFGLSRTDRDALELRLTGELAA